MKEEAQRGLDWREEHGRGGTRVDAVEAVLENRASMDQQSMSIAGRSLSRMSITDLMTFRDRYKAEYLKEVKIARIKNGLASGNTIKVNFGQKNVQLLLKT